MRQLVKACTLSLTRASASSADVSCYDRHVTCFSPFELFCLLDVALLLSNATRKKAHPEGPERSLKLRELSSSGCRGSAADCLRRVGLERSCVAAAF